MRENLKNADFTRFNAIKPRLLEVVDNMLATDIARLMAQIPKEEAIAIEKAGGDPSKPMKQPEVQGRRY
jgi:flagellar motility protein MotE (MotC chaperone)